MKVLYFAQKAFITDGSKLLLVQKSLEDPHNPGLWEVPGGRMDFGEDVDEHICREIREEVGLLIEPGPPFYLWQWQLEKNSATGEKTQLQIVAVARICKALTHRIDTSLRVEEDYLGEVRWVDEGALASLDFIPNMYPVLEAYRQARDSWLTV